jgi:hypothetical protein
MEASHIKTSIQLFASTHIHQHKYYSPDALCKCPKHNPSICGEQNSTEGQLKDQYLIV